MGSFMPPGIDLDEEARRLRLGEQPFALATVVRCVAPTSAKPGAKALVLDDGTMHGWIGGGCAQPTVRRVAKRAIAEDRPFLVRIAPDLAVREDDGTLEFPMTCSSRGTLEIFVEPVVPKPALLVFGASPVALAIPPLAVQVGFAVTLACPGLTPDAAPQAVRVVDGWTQDGLHADFAVVATQGFSDAAALRAAFDLQPRHLALVASGRKAAKLKAGLLDAGGDPARVDSIDAPAGVEIGAVSAGEIALSIVAGLVAARRRTAPAVRAAKAEKVVDAGSPAAPDAGAHDCCGAAPKPGAAR
ncbi:XdhC family protein [Sinimarinibacterium flocculans]|uniref:Xanthine dehydrogenase accessory factor n=1 Tax=Sinimarinibacterium flocculans TaxID=985250 RepID=A0A318E9M1_9GAMM|nr:XdhC family protein [Sinimarinibacterium flocculans]PXV65709.1 xanthine dehydrogenase accessory factor [Sinimarinibacterium flocculans]